MNNLADQPILTSGTFKGTREQYIALLKSVLRPATLKAWARAYGEYYELIAKDTGALRIGFNRAGRMAINSQRGTHEFRISKERVYANWTSRVNYAQYHQETGPTGNTSYRDPSTPGTKPFVWNDFKPVLAKHSKIAVREYLQQAGLMVRKSG